jgi:catechol 2,3-dioxygenase-like lactoylglutathione lyase family enzyme
MQTRQAAGDARFRMNHDVAIHVRDLEAAEAFYAGVLGFGVRDRGVSHLELDAGGIRLYLNEDASVEAGFIPSLDVSSAAAARQYLESHGCTIVRAAAEGSGFYFRDPFGLIIDVVER